MIEVTSTKNKWWILDFEFSPSCFGGWNTDSIQRFHELCAFVVTDCKNNGKFDNKYLSMMTTQTKNNKKVTTAVVAYDELDSEIMQV